MNPSGGSDTDQDQLHSVRPASQQSVTFDAINATAVQNTGSLDSDFDANRILIASDERKAKRQLLNNEVFKTRARIFKIAALSLLILGGLIFVLLQHGNKKDLASQETGVKDRFPVTSLPIASISNNYPSLSVQNTETLSINGQLNVNNSLVLMPTTQPKAGITGQLYYDQSTNKLSYYNGANFVDLLSGDQIVTSVGGANGDVTTGNGLTVNNNTLNNSGVLTIQGQSGNVSLVAGNGIAISGTTLSNSGLLSLGGQSGDIQLGTGLSITNGVLNAQTGIQSLSAATNNVTVTDLGNGTWSIGVSVSGGGGSGTVASSGGTVGKLAYFAGVQDIEDSLVSQGGGVVTVGGNLDVTGGLTLGAPLTVSNGGTGATTAAGARTSLGVAASGANSDITSLSGLTAALSVSQGGTGIGVLPTNSVLIGNGTSPISGVTTATAGQCLISTAGAPTFQTCPGSGGVASVNSLTGALTISGVSGGSITSAGTTITINDATAATKGLASFNNADLTVTSGNVDTVQGISTTATPTFGQLTLTSAQATNDMLVVNNTNAGATGNLLNLKLNGSSKLSVSPAGNLTLSGNVNGQTISAAANFTGNVTVANTLSVNTISPTSALAIGVGSQAFTLQGSNTSTIKATAGANTTTLGFQSPTANVTYNFPTAIAGSYDICTTAGNCAGVGGSVTTPGGTVNTLAKFTSSNAIANSIISDNGSTATIAGALAVNTITPTAALTVGATSQALTLQGAGVTLSDTAGGITNSLVFATPSGSIKTITLPNASGTVAVSASGPINIDANGNLSCPTCLTSGGGGGSAGVSSLNSATGALILQGVAATSITTAGSTITVNDASSTIKGLASFSATNLTVTSGNVDTVQSIAVTATPTFAGLSLTSALTVTNGGTGATTAAGARTNLGAAASGANSDITSLSGLTTALSVLQGGTGTTSLTANGVLVGNGTGPVTSVTGSNGQCLMLVAGTPAFSTCPGSGSSPVTSLDGLSGALTINNSTGSGTAITINNAAADGSTKGIATFNGTNFKDNGSGVINTIQDIATSASPSFAGLSLGAPLAVTSGGTGANTAAGARTSLGAAASGANSDITSLSGLTTALSVSQGGTGLTALTANQLLVAGSTTSITQLTNGTSGQCLVSNGAGSAPSFQTCTGAGGVSSLDALTGSITLANSSGSAGTITINNAAADGTTKGIAAFNGTNFTASSGVINTIQAINTTASPTFANITVTSQIQGSTGIFAGNNALTLGTSSSVTGAVVFKGSGGTGTITLAGPTTPNAGNFTLTLPAITANANVCTDNSICAGYAPISGGSNYVQLQGTTPGSAQTGHFNVTGTGIAGTSLQAPLIDTPTAATALNVGTTNANQINLNQNTVIASGKTLKVNGATSTSTFQVQNAASDIGINVNTVTPNSTLGLTNPSFETGTTGWAARTNCALSQSNTYAYFGTYSGKCHNTGSTSGMNYNLTLTAGTQYTLSFYAKTSVAGSILTFGYAYNGANETTYAQTGNYLGTGWQRYYLTFTPSSVSGTPYIFIDQGSDTTTRDIYVDGVQIEANSGPSDFKDATLTLGVVTSPLMVEPLSTGDGTALVVSQSGTAYAPLLVANTTTYSVGVGVTGTASDLFQVGDATTIDYNASSLLSAQGSTKKGLVVQGAVSQTANVLEVQNSSGTAMFSVGSGGATKVNSTSTTAFQIQNAGGTSTILDADTSNGRIGIGTNAPSEQLDVVGQLPSSTVGSAFTTSSPNYDVATEGQYAYTASYGKFDTWDITRPSAPVKLGTLTISTGVVSVKVSGKYAFVVNGTNNQVYVINVSNPASPTLSATIGASISLGTLNQVNAAAIQGRYLYIAGSTPGNNYILVYDIANPSSPQYVANVTEAQGVDSLAIQGTYLYATVAATGLQIVDISNPASPINKGALASSLATNTVIVQGRYAYLAGGTTLQAVNVSNPTSPASVGTVTLDSSESNIVLQGKYIYAAISSSHELQVVNVSNPASMSIAGTIATGTEVRSVALSGNYAYVSDYTNGKLLVYDMGGAYIQLLQAGAVAVTTLDVSNTLQVEGAASFANGVRINQGFSADGNSSIQGALQIQNASGVSVMNVDSANSQVTLGTASSLAGKLVFANASNNNLVTFQAATTGSGNNTITIPNETGTLCTTASIVCSLQTAYNASTGGANATPTIKLSSSITDINIQDADATLGLGGNFLSLRSSNSSGLGAVVFGFGVQGRYFEKPTVDSSRAMVLENSEGNTLFSADTSCNTGTPTNTCYINLGSTTGSTGGSPDGNAFNKTVVNIETSPNANTLTNIGSTAQNSGTATINIGYTNTSGGNSIVNIGSGPLATSGTTTIQGNQSLSLASSNGNISLATSTTSSNISLTTGTFNTYGGVLNINGVANPAAPTLTTSTSGGSLTANTYYYRLDAIGADGSSATASIPSSPGSVTTSGSASKNTLSWSAVSNATGYHIYRSIDGGNTWFVNQVSSATTSIVDNGTTYTWATGDSVGNFNNAGGINLQTGTGVTFDAGSGGTYQMEIFDNVNGGNAFTMGNYNSGGTIDMQAQNFYITDTSTYSHDFAMASTGAITLKNNTNSAAAFVVQNSGAVNYFAADTTNERIIIGPTAGDTTGAILVLGKKTTSGDPTGAEGAIYYNNTLKEFRCYRNGYWGGCDVDQVEAGFNITDDFINGGTANKAIGNAGWTLSNFGSGTSSIDYNNGIAPTADHPGILRIRANNAAGAANSGINLVLGNLSAGSMALSAGYDMKATAGIESTSNTTFRIGLNNESVAITAPTTGVWWEADPTQSANWRYCYVNATPATVCASSGVAITANQFARLEIHVNALGSGTSSVAYSISSGGSGFSTTVASVTVNTTNLVYPSIVCSSQNTVEQDADIDYYQATGTATALR